jgi:drug/metabolite transporter (DMT)-like permease
VFACVQVTMLGADLISGGRLRLREIAGLSVALLGLMLLTRPGLESPDPMSVVLMAIAGFSWGIYSLLGRKAGSPLPTTARNFALAVPLALAASLLDQGAAYTTAKGILLATVSGALTSGMGYVAWYAALPLLRKSHAAIVQLSVPPLAAVLGVILLGETVTSRLLIAAPLILFGIALAVLGRGPTRTTPPVVAGRG